MFRLALQGLLLGLAYVAPIGMQNSYVIQSAANLPRVRAYQVALITIFFDLSLALACYLGVGTLMDAWPTAKLLLLGGGALAVSWIGLGLIRSNPGDIQNADTDKPLYQIAVTCFIVTWLNPQALLDGTLFVGGFRASMVPGDAQMVFLGVCLASIIWFSGLTTLVTFGKHFFTPKIQKAINQVCGAVVLLYGLKLAYLFTVEISGYFHSGIKALITVGAHFL